MADSGITFFSCSRGDHADVGACVTCGARAAAACAFALSGRKAGSTCNRPLCPKHAIGVGAPSAIPHCVAHARLVGAKGVV
jgi:hypothetical protein